MRLLWLLLVLVGSLRPACGSAWMEIPATRSPNGQYALFYEKIGTNPNDPPYAVSFLGPSLSPASPQLVPDLRGKIIGEPGDWKTMADFDSQILLNAVARHAEAMIAKTQTDPAFSYSVQWTPDSRWVSLEGGAHKFWHMCAWRMAVGRFQQADLSKESKLLGDYFEKHQADLPIQQLGMDQKVKAIFHRDYDWAYVGWLSDGIFAVDGYPFFLRDKRWGPLREKDGDLYFLIDCQHPLHPSVIGICH